MEKVFLGLGSNVGDSARTIESAFADLRPVLQDARISSLYRSAARYYEGQPDFVNAVVSGLTSLDPQALLRAINGIEAAHGRDRRMEISKGPRTLDIDILLYGERIIVEKDLVVPHAGLRERKFALLPLLELEPSLVDPASGQPFLAILASLPAQGIYLLHKADYDRLYI
jgi:2-amino-4-hydroxy-6-hydroxymethyldihydropteridine diphosphokinase